MIGVIIPSHNQSNHIEQIIRSYEKQTLRPNLLLFVFDRCTDDSVNTISNIITDLNVRYVIKSKGENFSAGMTRDYGLEKLYELTDNIYKMILFTDGDCYPNEFVVEDHYKNCTIRNEPTVSCGRRMMQDESGTYHEDERMDEWADGFSFVDNDGRVLLSTKVTSESIFTYSCSLAFNQQAIDLCKNINKVLSNSSRVFNPEFDGHWGGEDNFISDCLFRTGNWITMARYRSCVMHPWHKPSRINEDRSLIWKMLSLKLKNAIISGLIEGPVTIAERCRFIIEPLKFGGVVNNIYSVSTTQDYSDYADLYFHSRNFLIVKPTEDRPIPKRVSELDLHKQYDTSAYIKHYLTVDDIVTDNDLTNYKYPRNSKSDCAYCRLDK